MTDVDTAQPMTRGERNLAAIRERGTDLAERIVLKEGVRAVSARGLAKELGISVGTLYNAFGDLDGVVRAVNLRSTQLLSNRLHAAVAAAGSDRRDALTALGLAYFDFAMEEPERWWCIFEHRPEKPDERETGSYQRDLLELLMRTAGVDPEEEANPERFVMLWASVHGLASLAFRPTIVAVPPEQARRYLVDLIEGGIKLLRLT